MTSTNGIPYLLPHGYLKLRDDYGRRWAVAQSFRHGGNVSQIVARAKRIHEDNCARRGVAVTPPVTTFDGETRELNSRGFYYKLYESLGWSIAYEGGSFVLAPPPGVAIQSP